MTWVVFFFFVPGEGEFVVVRWSWHRGIDDSLNDTRGILE